MAKTRQKYPQAASKSSTVSSEAKRKSNCDTNVNVNGLKRKREIQVVVCPSAFPDFTSVGGSSARKRHKFHSAASERNQSAIKYAKPKHDDSAKDGSVLDIQETIREVHKFGALGFTGDQAAHHKNSEYERLTGRAPKRHKIPTKILVGMRKKALEREERHKQELKESGVVSHHLGTANKGKRKREGGDYQKGDNSARGIFGSNRRRNKGNRRNMSSKSFGPSPDVGFMVKGMLKVKKPDR